MINIYKTQIDTRLEGNIIDSLMQLVSEIRREKVKKFRFQQDSFLCLFGDLLSRYAICERNGLNNSQLKFGVNTYNKPFLIKPSDLYFNVSHSGNWVVCAVADKLVGIDVEHIKPINFDIAKRFFTKEEYWWLMNQDTADHDKCFYLLWTLKESYIKADGRGLSIPLNTFSIDIKNDDISVITTNELNTYFFNLNSECGQLRTCG